MITALQKKTAEAIVNIFETGSVLGDYGQVTLLPGDLGQLTYGRSQVTLTSGMLTALLLKYISQADAVFAPLLRPFLPKLQSLDAALNNDSYFHNLLRSCADDPLMRSTQNEFFDTRFWQKAAATAQRMGITSALGIAVVYDSYIHGSWEMIKRRTIESVGQPGSVGEKKWIEAYVNLRQAWLVNHRIRILRKTVYRMTTFSEMIRNDLWTLDLPLVLRGTDINENLLNSLPRGSYDGPTPRSRTILVQSPIMRGLDVRLAQLALSNKGFSIVADGIFGNNSAKIVRKFQQTASLPVSGSIDSTEFELLGIAD